MAADPTAKHLEYESQKYIWQRIRDFVLGEDAVKKRAASYHPPATLYLEPIPYLPKPAGQDEQDYAQYLHEAEVYGATGRTVEGLVGAVFRIDPEIELTASLEELEEDADNKDTPLQLFAKNVLRGQLSTAGIDHVRRVDETNVTSGRTGSRWRRTSRTARGRQRPRAGRHPPRRTSRHRAVAPRVHPWCPHQPRTGCRPSG